MVQASCALAPFCEAKTLTNSDNAMVGGCCRNRNYPASSSFALSLNDLQDSQKFGFWGHPLTVASCGRAGQGGLRTVHGSFQHLLSVNLTLDLTIAPSFVNSVVNGVNIQPQGPPEPPHPVDPARLSISQPEAQFRGIATAKNTTKGHGQTPHGCECSRGGFKRRQIALLVISRLIARLDAQSYCR